MADIGIMQGASKASKMLDAFVLTHSVCAIFFATVALFFASTFGLFSTEPLPDIALDSIRWSSPFIYGFGILAALSLTMEANARFKIACMYAFCLGLAVPIGCYAQSTGRWNVFHLAFIVLFASLSGGYVWFTQQPHAFDRSEKDNDEKDPPLMSRK
mmetsp:Transcript_62161/g.110929  ORF Transcript_62161/g.110929 Transcript_62161/m.110929 type:complete len:157 (+) Transcript_62161:91-561(+)